VTLNEEPMENVTNRLMAQVLAARTLRQRGVDRPKCRHDFRKTLGPDIASELGEKSSLSFVLGEGVGCKVLFDMAPMELGRLNFVRGCLALGRVGAHLILRGPGAIDSCLCHPFLWRLRICLPKLVRVGAFTREGMVHPLREESAVKWHAACVPHSDLVEASNKRR
jgi:hypothetical protein